jgi:dCMP deaminase
MNYQKKIQKEAPEDLEVQESSKQRRLDMVYMTMAIAVSSLSHCKRSKVGAVIEKDGNVISIGYNGTPSGMDNCCEELHETGMSTITKSIVLHAEMNAVIKAAKTGNAVQNSTLYVTLSPCIECSKYILQSGIKRVVYLDQYRDTSGIDLLKKFIKIEQYVI